MWLRLGIDHSTAESAEGDDWPDPYEFAVAELRQKSSYVHSHVRQIRLAGIRQMQQRVPSGDGLRAGLIGGKLPSATGTAVTAAAVQFSSSQVSMRSHPYSRCSSASSPAHGRLVDRRPPPPGPRHQVGDRLRRRWRADQVVQPRVATKSRRRRGVRRSPPRASRVRRELVGLSLAGAARSRRPWRSSRRMPPGAGRPASSCRPRAPSPARRPSQAPATQPAGCAR